MEKLYVSNKDESARMFQNDFLEALTKVHPITPLIIFLPVIGFYLFKTSLMIGLTWLALVYFLYGLLIWTFTEYSLHRFIFHLKPIGPFSERVLFIFHGIHHDYPKDSRRLVLPPSASIPFSSVFALLFHMFFVREHYYPFFAGFITGYLCYDMGHYAIHHFSFKNSFFLAIKNHHLRHHYQNHDRGYGVSSQLWDFILGTEFKDKTGEQNQHSGISY